MLDLLKKLMTRDGRGRRDVRIRDAYPLATVFEENSRTQCRVRVVVVVGMVVASRGDAISPDAVSRSPTPADRTVTTLSWTYMQGVFTRPFTATVHCKWLVSAILLCLIPLYLAGIDYLAILANLPCAPGVHLGRLPRGLGEGCYKRPK